MAIQVNLSTSGDALEQASSASLKGSQSLAQSVDTFQKMKENREWASEEQKKMRQSKTRAETAKNTKEANLDELMGKFIENNPELYAESERTGLLAQTAKNFNQVNQADMELFAQYIAPVDFNDPEETRAGMINLMKAPGGAGLVKRLPISAMLEGDPQAIAQGKVLQAGFFQNMEFKRQQALAEQGQGYEQSNIRLRGDVQSDLSTQEFGQQSALSTQGFRQQGSLINQQFSNQLTRDEIQNAAAAGESAMDRALRLKLQQMQNDAAIDVADRRARAKGAEGNPIQKELGETATKWKGQTLTNIAMGKVKAAGLDVDEESIKAMAVEAGDQAIEDYNRAVARGDYSKKPQEIANSLLDYYVKSGRYGKTGGIDVPFSDKKVFESMGLKDESGSMLTDLAREYGQEDNPQPFVDAYAELLSNPEFKSMNIIDQRNVMKRVFEGD